MESEEKKSGLGSGAGAGERTGTGNAESVVHRLVIGKAADDALATIVERVNEGFQGGRVNRSQAATWILIRQAERINDTFIREIREDHFDEVALLEAALKQAKAAGKLPPELRAFLQKQMLGGSEDAKKRSKKELDE
ncbi:MAG: hypothetical protein JST04_12740 [Bdellovibrionales bacterium]|nr:hypothetical protein [Bdellovibrionales bacterium]